MSADARHVAAMSPDAVLSLFPVAARHARAEGRDGEQVRVELLEAVPGRRRRGRPGRHDALPPRRQR